MTGAGIMLMSGDEARGAFCSSDHVSGVIEDLQYTLGEGPCVDAYGTDRPVFEEDLADPAVRRWPAFTPSAVGAGARAVFGFPLQVGAVRIGALNLYRDRPGPLSDDQHADALVMADVAAQAILEMQADGPAGVLADELLLGSNFQFVVHQAAGMASVKLGIDVGAALVSIRARAFSEDVPLREVAEAIVARRTRLA